MPMTATQGRWGTAVPGDGDQDDEPLELPLTGMARDRWLQAMHASPLLLSGILDARGIVLDANQLAIEGCGLVRERVLGRPFWEADWWTPDEALSAAIRKRCEHALASGETYRAVGAYFDGTGRQRLSDLLLKPFTDERGNAFLSAIGADVTEASQAEATRQEVEQLKAALTSRTTIDQAIGILMAQNRCGPDEAFEILAKASSNRNVKLRELARQIVAATTG